jgi:hypothetical protein
MLTLPLISASAAVEVVASRAVAIKVFFIIFISPKVVVKHCAMTNHSSSVLMGTRPVFSRNRAILVISINYI